MLDKIIVNYWKLLSEKTSRLRRREETSLYKIILCGYLRFIELTLQFTIDGLQFFEVGIHVFGCLLARSDGSHHEACTAGGIATDEYVL